MNLDKKALAGFIKEVEDSRTRQKSETEFQRDVFKRARGKHFDVKALRIVLQRRAMETTKRDEQDYNVHAYELALGAKKDAVEAMEQGASAREAAKAAGLPRAAVTALKAGSGNGNFEPPHDPETGGPDVASQDGASGPAPTASLPLASTEREAEPAATPATTGEGDGYEDHEALQGVGGPDREDAGAAAGPVHALLAGRPTGASPCAEGAREVGGGCAEVIAPTVEMGHPASSTDALQDDLEIPPFLDKRGRASDAIASPGEIRGTGGAQ